MRVDTGYGVDAAGRPPGRRRRFALHDLDAHFRTDSPNDTAAPGEAPFRPARHADDMHAGGEDQGVFVRLSLPAFEK